MPLSNNTFLDFVKLIHVFVKHELFFIDVSQKEKSYNLFRKILKFLRPDRNADHGRRLREALIELGPVYIKLGQLLSTRGDIFPKEVIFELSQLQDGVPPLKDFDIESFITEQNFDPKNAIHNISSTPIASASIAQIYTGNLEDGTKVILKIVRPGVEEEIRRNMALLSSIANKVHKWFPSYKRFHLPRLMQDQEAILLGELDMHSESRNQIQLRRNFAGSDLLYVPRVYPEYTRTGLLVMEWVDGISIGQINNLRGRKVDIKKLAHKGVETFFTQVFIHNFFHADMHPGNIFVDVSDPKDPKYVALDSAIVGSLSEQDKIYLAKSVHLFFNRDYLGVAELQIESSWVSATTDPHKLASKIEELCEPIFEKPLSEIYFAQFLADLFQVAREFDMEVQPQLILLQKTLFYVEGVGRELYPDLDLWATAKPFMTKWMADQYGVIAQLNKLLSMGPKVLDEISGIPSLTKKNEAQIRQLNRKLALSERNIRNLSDGKKGNGWKSNLSRLFGLIILLVIYSKYSVDFYPIDLVNNLTDVFNASIALVGLFLLLRR